MAIIAKNNHDLKIIMIDLFLNCLTRRNNNPRDPNVSVLLGASVSKCTVRPAGVFYLSSEQKVYVSVRPADVFCCC